MKVAPRNLKDTPLYTPVGPVFFRAPLLPISTFSSLIVRSNSTTTSLSEKGFGSDASHIKLLDDPKVRLAVLVGSKSLYDAWDRDRQGGNKKVEQLRRKVIRYLVRMSTRSTPYGLFSGVALVDMCDSTRIRVSSQAHTRQCRLDMGWLNSFVLKLESNPVIRRHLRFCANPLIRFRSGRIVLSERHPRKETDASAEVSAKATPVVMAVLELTKQPIAYSELVFELRQRTGATDTKIEDLLQSLWDQTFLLTDLMPTLLCRDPSERLLDHLRKIPEAEEMSYFLRELLEEASRWGTQPAEQAIGTYLSLSKKTSELLDEKTDTPFQVDMALTLSEQRIGKNVCDEVAKAAQILLRLSPFPAGNPALHSYRHAFMAKFNDGREVPLIELFHTEKGLGPYGGTQTSTASSIPNSPQRQKVLLDIACNALRTGTRIVRLTEEQLNQLENWKPSIDSAPLSLDLYASVIASSFQALDTGDFKVAVGSNVGSLGAGRNIARFSHLLGSKATNCLKSIAETEDQWCDSSFITVELNYQPKKARLANVVIRPTIRKYGINLGFSEPDSGTVNIPVSEIVVGVSAGKFYLRWTETNQFLRVVNGHMLNTMLAGDVVRFVSDAAVEGGPLLSAFHWGSAENFPYLPRVEHGRIILRPAEWRLSAGQTTLSAKSLAEFQNDLALWRSIWVVPRRVYLCYSDNRLLLDLDEPFHIEELFQEFKKLSSGSSLVLQEAIPDIDDGWVEGETGRFLSELVVPLVLSRRPDKTRKSSAIDFPIPHENSVNCESIADKALKLPGSDWLYFKLYCSEAQARELLTGHLKQFCDYITAQKMADLWFFVQYTDPAYHLRIRFRGDPSTLACSLIPAVNEWVADLASNGYGSHFAIETYDREIERYGGLKSIEIIEAIFHADSITALSLHEVLSGPKIEYGLEEMAVLTIDRYLAVMGLDPLQRESWLKKRLGGKAGSGDHHRKHSKALRTLVAASRSGRLSDLLNFGQVFEAADIRLRTAATQLVQLSECSELTRSFDDLMISLIHMHCNRLMGISPDLERKALSLLLRTNSSLIVSPLQF